MRLRVARDVSCAAPPPCRSRLYIASCTLYTAMYNAREGYTGCGICNLVSNSYSLVSDDEVSQVAEGYGYHFYTHSLAFEKLGPARK